MFTEQDFKNGNIDINLLQNLEIYGSKYFLDILNKNNNSPQYKKLKEICSKYFTIYYVENIFSKEDIIPDLFELIQINEIMCLEFFELIEIDTDFIKECLLTLFNINYNFTDKFKLYTFFLNCSFDNYDIDCIQNSVLGLLFQNEIDTDLLHNYMKIIVKQKDKRQLIFDKILYEVDQIKKESNSMFIMDTIKYINEDNFKIFLQKILILKNILKVLLLFWEKGINLDRLNDINQTYYKKETEYTFLTHCFFSIHLIMNVVYKNVNEMKKNLIKSLQDLEDFGPFIDKKIIELRKSKFIEWKQELTQLNITSVKIGFFLNKTANWIELKKYASEDIIENIIEFNLNNLDYLDRNSLINLFLKIDELSTNPFLKLKFIELLVNDFCNTKKSITHHDKFTNVLLTQFINMEKNVQFYEKFAPRFNIIFMLNVFQRQPYNRDYYKYEIQMFAKENTRFLFLLLNDIQYLSEEAIENLKKIRQHEEEINILKPNELIQATNLVKSFLTYSREFLLFLDIFSQNFSELFTIDEIVDKVAMFLNFMLIEFAGNNTLALKVKEPKKLFFEPVKILATLGNIYINLGYDKKLITALSNERLYNKDNLNRMISILIKKDAYETQTWFKTGLLNSLKQKIENYKETKIDYDDYDPPLDLCDPLMTTLMEEPVKLPTSDIFMDKSVIIKHLLSDETDPFNRKSLTPDILNEYNKKHDIVKETEKMKKKIKLWKASINIVK